VAGTDSREDDEAAKIELTYSNTSNINPARQMLGKLVVCISQVIANANLLARPMLEGFV
jgi:hypothetical protein